jgi:hypothetical protein
MSFIDVYCYVFGALGLCILFGKIPVGIGSVVLTAATAAAIAAPISGSASTAIETVAETINTCELPSITASPLAYAATLASCYSK